MHSCINGIPGYQAAGHVEPTDLVVWELKPAM